MYTFFGHMMSVILKSETQDVCTVEDFCFYEILMLDDITFVTLFSFGFIFGITFSVSIVCENGFVTF